MKKTYKIYRMENRKINDEVLKFYLPEEGVPSKIALKRKAGRLLELHDLKKKGYVITAEILVNREDYLNTRLNVAVADYCKLDNEERQMKTLSSYWVHKLTNKSLCADLEPIVESKRVCLKRIVSLVRRLNNEDLDIRNEVAIMLYDQYVRDICR